MRSFWRTPVDQEVESELAFHLAMATRDLMEKGMSERDARAEAQRRFGDTAAVNAECTRYGNERDRNARRAEYRTELRQDLGFAARQLVKARGFTFVAVLTLALGIGATAAVFSVLDAIVLRPLPFPNADRIVDVMPVRVGTESNASAPEFLGQAHVPGFEYVAASISGSGMTLSFADRPETIGGGRVSADFFKVFGIQPELGRTFSHDEDQPGQANVVVLSHHLWATRFASDRGIIGRTLTIDAIPRTVIGVMPASFELTAGGDELWLPLAITPEQAAAYGEHDLTVTARLAANTTREQATAAASAAEQRVIERMPDRTSKVADYRVELLSYKAQLIGDYGERLFILLGAVGFVLLIACVNVANLLLARGASRTRELAIRTALGAGRARLVRQLLTESLVLSIAGAIAGLAVAFGLLRVIVSVAPTDVPRIGQVAIDGRVLLFTLGVSVVCSVVFGLMPALRTANPQLQDALRQGGRGGISARDSLRAVLVAAEVALAITLVVGAGLLIRSAILASRVDPGFDAHGVLTARLVLPGARYPSAQQSQLTYLQIRDAAARIPGVRSAALTSVVPMSGSQMAVSVREQGTPKSDHSPSADFRAVSSGYLATMGIPLLAGRDIGEHDTPDAPEAAVINVALAKLLWPTLQPAQVLGKRLTTLSRDPDGYATVVGVAGDIHEDALTTASRPEIFISLRQMPDGFWAIMQRSLVVVIKAANAGTSAESFVKPLESAVASVDPSLPLADHHTMDSYLRDSQRTARMNTLLLSLLGGIALVLAMVGIYGVVSYFVSQRTNEIGLRMALGATPATVWRFVIERGLRPIVAGLVAGVALSLATTSVLQGQLYGVTAHDPMTLGAVGVLLLGIALVAMYVPARRAMRIPPIVALNET